jgi:glycosyltransferase involved in cell wall biosynthesis
MTLQWLISTYGNGIRNVENILLFPEFGLSYLVSHQDPEDLCPELPEFLERRDVSVHRIASTGLSKNRNNALKMADADIVVLADDDIRLHPAYPHHVRAAFKKFPDADVICFQIRTPEGSPPYKNYPELPGYLTKFSQLKGVSSIEIAFRRKKILENKLTFDERFGLGTQADSGEEFLFLANCLRKGLKIMFFPSYIVEHEFNSSVKSRPYYEDRRLFSTGAQNYVLYRDFAYLRNLLALVRRWPSLKKAGISASHFLKMKNAGCRYIRLRDRSVSFSD